jgi:hypothetical protein
VTSNIGNLTTPTAAVEVAQSTPISTAGTTTVASGPGAFFGVSAPVLGTGTTSTSVSVFDGTSAILGTATVTAANQVITALPAGLGQKFNTSLVVVTAGTGPAVNVLWD